METPGYLSIASFNLTAAGTQTSDETTVDLEGLLALCMQARLVYGSGGTTLKLYVQTSLDQGATWIDIACIVFGLASEVAALNFSALTPKTSKVTPTDAALTDNTAVDGILGDRFRCKAVSTGTFAGSTTLAVGAVAR